SARAHARRARRAEDPEGDQRPLHRRAEPAPRRLRRAQGRRVDDVRVVDLLRRVPGARSQSRRPQAAGPARHARGPAAVGVGVGGLYVPSGLVDGPLPAHYEPAESPVANPLYRQQSSPVLKYWKRDGNELAPVSDPRFPYIITTYRLTEHYLSGAMSRWSPWLA